MNPMKSVLSISLLLTSLSDVCGSGCDNIDTKKLPVINICEKETWSMGRVLFNITSANMGSSTRCNCTLKSQKPGDKTTATYTLWNVEANASRCVQSFIQVTGSGSLDLTCSLQPNEAYSTSEATYDVTIVLGRTDTAVQVSYCLFLQPDGWEANSRSLTCQSDTPPQTSPETTPSSTSMSSFSTPSAQSSESSSSSTQASISSSSSKETLTVVPGSTTEKSSTPTSATTFDGSTKETGQGFPIGPVAGGVGGSVALIIIIVIIVIVVIVCKRRNGRQDPIRQRGPEVEDHGYCNPRLEEDLYNPQYSTADDFAMGTDRAYPKTSPDLETPSSSQTRSLGGMLAASSNPYELEEDTPQDNGAVSINPTAGSALVTLANSDTHPPDPTSDVYAVVNKSKGKKPLKPTPPKPPKHASLSTSSNGADVTAAASSSGGDEYAVVDKFRKRGGNVKTDTDGLPLAVPEPPPVSDTFANSSPGLLYADLEEVRGEGRRSAPSRPPATVAMGTDYAVIDHQATADLSSEV